MFYKNGQTKLQCTKHTSRIYFGLDHLLGSDSCVWSTKREKQNRLCLITVFIASDLSQCNTSKSTYCSLMHIKYSTSANKNKPHRNICITQQEKKIAEHHNAAIIVLDSMQKCIVHHIGGIFLEVQAACAGCLIAIGSRSSNFRRADHTSLLCPEQGKWGWKSARGCFIFR